MAWVPNEDELRQILNLLKQTISGDTTTQRNVQIQLVTLSEHPQFCLYLVYIMADLKELDEPIRSVSGLILKNILLKYYQQLRIEIKNYVKTKVCSIIGDSSSLIRATVGILLTTIYTKEDGQWNQILHYLVKLLENLDYNLLDGSLGALQKICEDSASKMNEKDIEIIVRPCFKFFNYQIPKIRSTSLSIVNNILLFNSSVVGERFDEFIVEVFQLANDNDNDVIKELCKCLTLICETFFDKIVPQLDNIMKFMIHKTQDVNDDIALEACEFWLTITDHAENDKNILAPILPQLLPVLLKSIRYSQEEIIALKCDIENDSQVPDKEEDIKPRHYRPKNNYSLTGNSRLSEINKAESFLEKNCYMSNEDNDSDNEEDEEDDDTNWTLRKCAAATLDVITNIFGVDCLPILLPHLKELLHHKEWETRESGILCLGAIAEGCMSGITPFMDDLFPYLMTELNSSKALVRSISCWTLSRYCNYICQDTSSPAFQLLIKGLLEKMVDSNKNVQRSACSAFSNVIEEVGRGLIIYFQDIVTTLAQCYKIYQARNLLILYDCTGTLADVMEENLQNDYFIQCIMPLLIERWKLSTDCDRQFFPLLECISSVALSLKEKFIPYCKPVFERCVTLIDNSLNNLQKYYGEEGCFTYIDREIIIVCFDLLAELTDILGKNMEQFYEEVNIGFLIIKASSLGNEEVKQSTFALIGDIFKKCPRFLLEYKHQIADILVANITNNNTSLVNNAVWAFSAMIFILKEEIDIYLSYIIPVLTTILNCHKLERTLSENTAITIGKISLFAASKIASYLPNFIRPWCLSLRNVRDNEEKVFAFEGIICLIYLNPTGILGDFVFFCDAIGSWENPPQHLRNQIIGILNRYKEQIGLPFWNEFLSHCPENLQQKLKTFYGA
uniref:Transportin-1 n=1 Tax=Strongyloides stercoralis TaxID=6248 RepID=A0A0K0EL49_STRER